MGLKTNLNSIRDKIITVGRKNDPDEQNTKQSLILPVIEALGYDIHNTAEVELEYNVTRSRKVDLAIKHGGTPAMIFECKRLSEELDGRKIGQLRDYFIRVPSASIGVLTNGAEYKFFRNLSGSVKEMDMRPFVEIDLEDDVSDDEIAKFRLFSKEAFDAQRIAEVSQEMMENKEYRDNVVEYLLDQVGATRMDLELARLLANKGDPDRRRWTEQALQDSEGHIKAAFQEFANQLVEKSLEGHNVTAEEVEAHQIIRYVLRDKVNEGQIFRNEGTNYCTIQLDDSTRSRKRLCRLHFKRPTAKRMELDDNGEFVDINAVYDIMRYADRLNAIADGILAR